MSRRIAAAMSLIAFAVCLVAGIEADNPLGTILARSLVAMAGTLVIGLVVGAMAQKMLDEHLATTHRPAESRQPEREPRRQSHVKSRERERVGFAVRQITP